ncbi:MAG: flippase-like domain-containing protein [Elusimicrobia bacterium]|nr:flippase-like domain-containing protein [Elusimicrobiota bacterium]
MKAKLSAAAGLAFGALLLWFALRGTHPAEVLAAVKGFDPRWAPVLLLLPVLDICTRAMRWKLLLQAISSARVTKLFQLESVGLALNNVLFMRLGEFARAVLCGLELEVHAFAVLATIVVERLCDACALFSLFAVVTTLTGVPVDPVVRLAAAGLSAGIVVVLVAAAYSEKFLVRLAQERLRPWPRLAHLAEDLAAGTRGLRAPGAWWRVALLSYALWTIDALVFWSAARAIDLEPLLSFGQAVAVVTIASAATAFPTAPGGFGNFEAAVKWVLVRFGAAPAEAFAFAAFTHLVMYTIVTVLGVVFLYRLGHTIEGLKKAVERLRAVRRPRLRP